MPVVGWPNWWKKRKDNKNADGVGGKAGAGGK